MTKEQNDGFRGDNALLIASINALLALDADGSIVPHGVGGHARALLRACANRLKVDLPTSEPFEIDWPEYHDEAMGCGLEDCNITDRYEAMRHGWDCAIERVADRLPETIYTTPPTA